MRELRAGSARGAHPREAFLTWPIERLPRAHTGDTPYSLQCWSHSQATGSHVSGSNECHRDAPDALPHDMDLPACVHGGENASDDGSGCLRLLRILTPDSFQKTNPRALRFRGPDSRGCSELLGKLMRSRSGAFFSRTQARILGNAPGVPRHAGGDGSSAVLPGSPTIA